MTCLKYDHEMFQKVYFKFARKVVQIALDREAVNQ